MADMLKEISKVLAIAKVLRKQLDAAFKIMTPEQQAEWIAEIKSIGQPYNEEE